MAGESPGRAEQQESSGEATGGGVVDPRIAVFRGVAEASRETPEPATGEPEFAPEPPEAEGAAEPDRRISGTPDGVAEVDGGARGATPDAEEAPPADGAGDDAESRTDDAAADGAGDGAEESGTTADASAAGSRDPSGDDEEPAAEEASAQEAEEPEESGKPEGEREEAPAAGDAGREDESSESSAEAEGGTGADAEAEPDDTPDGPDGRGVVDGTPEDASEDAVEDATEGEPGTDATEGPSEGPGAVKGGSGAHEAPGGGRGAPKAGEGTLTLRAPRTDAPAAPVRDRTLTLRAPSAPTAPVPSASAPSAPAPSASAPSAPAPVAPTAPAPSASAPVATPARRSGTFVPLRTDDRPAVRPEPPAAPGPTAAEAGGSRTKQMPLPPDPDEALKLLAELTNTPPPPETPLRTTVRRIKIWTPLVLLLVVAFCVAQALRPLPEPELVTTAETSFTFEGEDLDLPWPSEGQAVMEAEGLGRMGEFGEQKPTPIASVAKVMTTYVILRDHPIKKGSEGETLKVDQKAEDQFHSGSAENESVVSVDAGQKLSVYEALEAVMLPSANNIARLLARWDAGSEEAFVEKMNAAAKELGMDDTTYTDPSGLEATTVSTASDQVKLGHAAMENPVFAEIAGKIEYTDSHGTVWKNYNRLSGYNGIVGIKTGTSTKAGGNLLFAAYRKIGGTKQLVIGAMLDQQKAPIIDTVLGRSRTLIDGARDALASDTIIRKGDVVGYVDDGLGGHTPVVAGEDVTAIGWAGLKVDISVEPDKAGLPHKASAGDQVGELVVGNGDSTIKVPVLLQKALVEPPLGSKLTRVA
ncbi:D-alanyl-D-alanine carboxypeptidase [Streptomyces sp. NPDC026673]|uniref:D-alanyl-D-alanine carboxypeptidase n=1 Tax=Streptomyces sp. NPDC026673 TaxID=3155724 RepID=UPI0033CF6C55